MSFRPLLTTILAAALLVAPACHCPHHGAEPANAHSLTRTELYFGMTIPGGGAVTDDQWRTFVDDTVTPLFPQGLTIVSATGQWREQSGTIAREPARILILLHEPTPQANTSIERIRTAYKDRFHQEAVMRTDDRQRVSF